jgi:tryptophan synthase alpha chain
MSRISHKFNSLKSAGKKALIPFVTAGDPNPFITVKLMHKLVAAGADLLELGVPFSDPMADGPVIQRASERALEHNVTMHNVLDMVREFRQTDNDTPIVLMGYLNPIEVMGYQAFSQQASEAGIDGAIIVDLPPQEAHDLLIELKNNDIDPIFLLAPTSTEKRIEMITSAASGFVYYVSLKGVTGAATLDIDAVKEKISQIRSKTDLPIGVGFGISNDEMAGKMSVISDAVIVGSALVRKIEENADNEKALMAEAETLIGGMRKAMDNA